MSSLRPSTDNTLSYASQGSTYVIHYFQNHGMTGAIRALLSLALNKDQWSNQFQDPMTWRNDKDKTPCGTLPILYETTSTGETITIPESDAIERYLARKYGYMGSTPWEETLVNIFHAQAMTILVKWIQKVAWAIEGTREQAMEYFLKATLPEWITTCEKQLKHNGSNGHFVGDMLTLADIKTATVLDVFLSLESSDILNVETCPNLWKLKEMVDLQSTYAAYRRSEEFKSIDSNANACMGGLLPYDAKRAHIFT